MTASGFDVLCIGNAIVDVIARVEDDFGSRPGLVKGSLNLIDEVRADGATCTRTFRADEPFYAGHYPGNPITPGVLLCESVFQAAAVYLTKKLQSEGGAPAGKTPVLCRIEEAKFKGMVKPGDTVSIEVKHVETLQQFHFLTGTVRRDGKAVLTIRFALALVDQPA